ncbi:CdaR family protein [Desulfolutivibrio sp.]|uniref:CdaR family protein n=1 Tax=Desulfolutivibrio sp. TaxID=2773296 RepID=UPI002F964B41
MKSNWQQLLLAFVLAVFCWYLVTGREKVDSWVPMKVEMAGMPDGLFIRGGMLGSVEVLVRGPRGMVRKIEESQLVYPLNLSDITPGKNVVGLDPASIPISKVFDVVEIRPSRIELDVERRVSRDIPIKPVLGSPVPEGHVLAGTRVRPETARVTGAEKVVAAIEDIRTNPLTFGPASGAMVEERVGLDIPEGLEASPLSAMVTLHFAPRLGEATVRVPVRAFPPERVEIGQKTVTLRIKGPVQLLNDKGFEDLVEARVDVKPGAEVGRHDMPYQVKMPQGCELLEARPDKVSVTVK